MNEIKQNLPIKITNTNLKHDYTFRICLIGDAGVGKTSILTRYCDDIFKETYANTIGVDFRVITLKQDNILTKLHIWDTAGQERFKSVSINYFRNSHGFIFVYDITRRETFHHLDEWINSAFSCNRNTDINILIGNKSDSSDRQVSEDEGKEFARRRDMCFLETSALNNENISYLFEYFGYMLIEYYSKNGKAYCINEKLVIENESNDLLEKNKKVCC